AGLSVPLPKAEVGFIAASRADEVVGSCGVAEFRPALGAPVLHYAGFAHEGLEALRLAHGCVGRMPEQRIVSTAGDIEAGFSPFFERLKRSKGSANVKVDKPQGAQSRQALRRGGFGRGT